MIWLVPLDRDRLRGDKPQVSFDFETILVRKGSGCIKYDRRPELDPFWVADMDFRTAPVVLDAVRRRVEHGVFGYSQPQDGLREAILGYLKNRRGVDVAWESIIHLGGLVPALSLAVKAFCAVGDAVMTCTPVYPPFLSVHQDHGAELITVDHVKVDDQWTFDWEGMEQAVTPKTRVFLLCNPQNPLGRVFSRSELEKLGEFCETHDLVLVSDEIHCDLVMDEDRTPHVSALNLPESLQSRCLTLLAPSKTWNIAGLGYAFAVIPDPGLRKKFETARGHLMPEINSLAYHAAEAAYREGEPWRLELLNVLRSNRDALVDFVNSRCPKLHVEAGEATYLAWIDARELGVDNPATFFEKHAGLFLSDGAFFGWPGWIRFNFGCPWARLNEGLEKLAGAL